MVEQFHPEHAVVAKFGGASVANADRIRNAAMVIAEHDRLGDVVVVTSAMKGVTDDLVRMTKIATGEVTGDMAQELERLYGKHFTAIAELGFDHDTHVGQLNGLQRATNGLYATLTCLTSEKGKAGDQPTEELLALSDEVQLWGERTFAPVLTAAAQQEGVDAEYHDAAEVLITTHEHGDAQVLPDLSRERIQQVVVPLLVNGKAVVFPGFYGARVDNGRLATLGRNGSDVAATAQAAGLHPSVPVREVNLYKEGTDGVCDKDPEIYGAGAKVIPHMTYEHATEVAIAGAKVLHRRTVEPVRHFGIPIFVRQPKPDRVAKDIYEHRGTKIWSPPQQHQQRFIGGWSQQ